MGTFEGHLLPGTAFFIVGLWHLYCVIGLWAKQQHPLRQRQQQRQREHHDEPEQQPWQQQAGAAQLGFATKLCDGGGSKTGGNGTPAAAAEAAAPGVDRSSWSRTANARSTSVTAVSSNYYYDCDEYISRSWFPVAQWSGPWRYLELYFICFCAMCSISAELVISPKAHWPLDQNWSIPPFNLAHFEHSSISLFLLLFGLISLIDALLASNPNGGGFLPHGLLHLVAGLTFSQEYLLFYFHTGDHMAVEGHYHLLLRIPIAITICCIIAGIFFPRVLLLTIVRSMGLMLQGLWLNQTAFSIFLRACWPRHCVREDKLVKCLTPFWDYRAKEMANLQFSWWTACVVILTIALISARFRRMTLGE